MKRANYRRIENALKLVTNKGKPRDFPIAFRMVGWELMKTQTQLRKLEERMDKKMHQVTKRMQTAEGALKAGKKKVAEKVLKKAEKKNEKLVKYDRDVRDPMIAKCKAKKKGGKHGRK